MNRPAWLFGGSTLLLAASCLYLLTQPRMDSALTGAAAHPDAELRSELTQLRAERDRLETDVRSMRAAQAGPVFAPQPTAAASPLGPAPASPPPPIVMRPDISPKSRRTMARLRNGKMFKQLGLPDAQVESLLDVLSAQEERAMAVKPGDPSTDPEEVRARNHAEVAAVIGRESAEKLDAWQQQAMLRMEMRRMRDQLDDVGEPLSTAQSSRIEELMRAHPPSPPPQRQRDEPPDAFMSRFKSWRQDSREQVRAEVSTVLEPRQLERYDELDEMSRTFEKSFAASLPAPNTASAIAGRAAPPMR